MHPYSTLNKVGFVVALLLGLVNVASLATPTPDGEVGPPMAILVLDAVLGAGVIVAVLIGWLLSRKAAIRAATVLLILAAITALPAFTSPEVPSGLVAAAGAYVLVTILTIVMMLKPASRA
ncbi:MAG TPA: hypothetical protein PLT68_07970 [Actinomycetota bacterium]|nr:hypothetical protein [Actinomycetota bacterium]